MTIRFRLFAILRDAAGVSEVTMDIASGATAFSAVAKLAEDYPSLLPHLGKIAYAINQTYQPANTALQDGDELALIPPVSGG